MRSPVLRRTGQSNPISMFNFRLGALGHMLGSDSADVDSPVKLVFLMLGAE